MGALGGGKGVHHTSKIRTQTAGRLFHGWRASCSLYDARPAITRGARAVYTSLLKSENTFGVVAVFLARRRGYLQQHSLWEPER